MQTVIERHDVLVLGSGEAGKYIAWTLAKEGRRAAVVERGLIGGSCRTSRACRARMSSTARESRLYAVAEQNS